MDVRRGVVVGGALAFSALVALAPPARADSTWVDHARAAAAARQSGDLAGSRAEYLRVRDLIGETPGVAYQLARLAARLGDRAEALRGLEVYARSGLTRDVAADSDFVALRADTAFEARVARIRANAEPIARATVLHTFSDAGLLIEDVAWDAHAKRFLATSIVRGEVIEVSDKGAERVFATSPHERRWGLLGTAVDAERGLLWVSEVATPTCDGWSPADSGRSGLLAFALADGRLVRHLHPPDDGRAHELGDICVGPEGTVYASDGPSGAVWRVRPGGESLEALVPAGTFGNPQGPALAPDGTRLHVADYGRGIGIVDLATRAVSWLAFEPGVALQGIDGLNAVPGALIAVQNGVRPKRVARLELDAGGTRAVAWTALESGSARLDEPTHGVVVGDTFVFIGRSGWERVGDDRRLRADPLAPPPLLLVAPLVQGTERIHSR